MERECDTCGTAFTTKWKQGLYCSPGCAARAYWKRRIAREEAADLGAVVAAATTGVLSEAGLSEDHLTAEECLALEGRQDLGGADA